MRSEEENVALQGIEFWSTLAEEEFEHECQDEENAGSPPACKRYCQAGVQHSIPVLLDLLAKQVCIIWCFIIVKDDGEDEDEWNTAKSASVCLTVLSRIIRDTMLPVCYC